MRGVGILPGVVGGSLAAGPAFVAGTAIMAGSVVASDASRMIPALPLFVVFGFFVAIGPVAIGTALLAMLGRKNVGARFAPFWALVGAGLGALLGGVVDGVEGATIMAITGAICALACRAGTRWQDVTRYHAHEARPAS